MNEHCFKSIVLLNLPSMSQNQALHKIIIISKPAYCAISLEVALLLTQM